MAIQELEFEFDDKPLPEAIVKWLKAAREGDVQRQTVTDRGTRIVRPMMPGSLP